MVDVAVTVLLLAGAGFACIAGVGLVRMPDVYIRMHAATKAGTLGAGLIMAAVAINFAELGVVLKVLAVVAFLFITAPVAAHMIARAAYRTGVPLWERTVVDEWARERATAGPEAGPEPASPPASSFAQGSE